MSDPSERLGKNGAQEIKAHPFFRGIDWKNLRKTKSPFIPNVKSEEDCSRFDKFDEEDPFYRQDAYGSQRKRKDINFPGYTFKREVEDQKTKLVQALKEVLSSKEIESISPGRNTQISSGQQSTMLLK